MCTFMTMCICTRVHVFICMWVYARVSLNTLVSWCVEDNFGDSVLAVHLLDVGSLVSRAVLCTLRLFEHETCRPFSCLCLPS